MSRPPTNKNSPYNGNTINGGLIDFQENHLASCSPYFSTASAYPTPSAYTSTGYQFNPATGMYTPATPGVDSSAMFMGASTMPTGYPMQPVASPAALQAPVPGFSATPNTQVFMGAPSEVYVQGRVYKAVDDTPVKAVATAAVAPTVAKTEIEDTKVDIDQIIKERVDNRVDEFMSKVSTKSSAYTPVKNRPLDLAAPMSKQEIISQLKSHNAKMLRSKKYRM